MIAGSNRFDLKKVASYKVSTKINRDGQVLRHIVNLKYKDDATKAQINEAERAFENLKNEIPAIANLEWG